MTTYEQHVDLAASIAIENAVATFTLEWLAEAAAAGELAQAFAEIAASELEAKAIIDRMTDELTAVLLTSPRSQARWKSVGEIQSRAAAFTYGIAVGQELGQRRAERAQ